MDIMRLKEQLKDAARQGVEKREEDERNQRGLKRESNRTVLEEMWPKIMSDIASAVTRRMNSAKIGDVSLSDLPEASRQKGAIVTADLEEDSVERMMCEDLEKAGAKLKFESHQGDRPTSGTAGYTIYIVNPEGLALLT